jgi:hypothetical protein
MIARLSKTNLVAAVAMTLALLGCTAGGGGSPSGSVMATGGSSTTKILTGPGFGPMTAPPGSSLRSIDGSASNDVWAVGDVHHGAGERSLVEHWDGSSWSVVDVPDVGGLADISVLAPDDVWAVSYSTVIHWDGTTWDSMDLSKGNARSLSSISATAPNDVWVAGERPGFKVAPNTNGWSTMVMHFDGHTWTQEDTPDQGTRNNYLKGVEALSPTDVWAAGYSEDIGGPQGATLAIHWDGTKWSLVPPPNPSPSLNIIWGTGQGGGGSVWALGDYRGPDRHLTPLILEWTGGSWHRLPLRGDIRWSAASAAGASQAQTWVVGSEATSSFAIASCDSSVCRTKVPPDDQYDMQASSVWALSDTDAWLVGTRNATSGATTPIVQHWDGTRWSDVDVPSGVSPTPSPS